MRLVGLLSDNERPTQAEINCFIQPTFDINIAEAMPADYER